MATKGNLAWQLDTMLRGKAVTTAPQAIFAAGDAKVICYSSITTAAALDGITDGSLGPGCIHICVSDDAVGSVQVMYNQGTATAPTFFAMISAGSIDPDA